MSRTKCQSLPAISCQEVRCDCCILYSGFIISCPQLGWKSLFYLPGALCIILGIDELYPLDWKRGVAGAFSLRIEPTRTI